MTSKEKDRLKQLQDKCQNVLMELLRDDDNKYCVDCDSKGPRWASWNLGVFLCIRCAGIHRNLGVHISKVKSVNLDAWTPEQVVSLQQMGNSRARAVYEANLPDNFRRPQSDSSLESFIRAKYEHKKYIAREWVPPPLPKVNWEKEIDEEMDRQKRKKNKYDSKIQIKLTNIEIPQLPKPKSASEKTEKQNGNPPAAPKVESAVDLLQGVEKSNADDAFSSFLSAAPNEVKTENKSSEEESFFNQPAPSEKEKTQLTKDSILALYGQPPTYVMPQTYPQGFAQPQQNNFMYGQPFNAFPQQQPQEFFQPAQCFGIQPRTQQPVQGISVPNPFLQPTQPVVNLQQQFGNLSLNQSLNQQPPPSIVPTNIWP